MRCNKLMCYAAVMIVAVAGFAYLLMPYLTKSTEVVQVTGNLVKTYGDNSKYLVYTDHGVYENTDTWYYFKFDSSDVQAKLMSGGKFKISTYGIRVPFLSKYKNIISAEKA